MEIENIMVTTIVDANQWWKLKSVDENMRNKIFT